MGSSIKPKPAPAQKKYSPTANLHLLKDKPTKYVVGPAVDPAKRKELQRQQELQRQRSAELIAQRGGGGMDVAAGSSYNPLPKPGTSLNPVPKPYTPKPAVKPPMAPGAGGFSFNSQNGNPPTDRRNPLFELQRQKEQQAASLQPSQDDRTTLLLRQLQQQGGLGSAGKVPGHDRAALLLQQQQQQAGNSQPQIAGGQKLPGSDMFARLRQSLQPTQQMGSQQPPVQAPTQPAAPAAITPPAIPPVAQVPSAQPMIAPAAVEPEVSSMSPQESEEEKKRKLYSQTGV